MICLSGMQIIRMFRVRRGNGSINIDPITQFYCLWHSCWRSSRKTARICTKAFELQDICTDEVHSDMAKNAKSHRYKVRQNCMHRAYDPKQTKAKLSENAFNFSNENMCKVFQKAFHLNGNEWRIAIPDDFYHSHSRWIQFHLID